MAESIEFYLDWCQERGKDPEKPFSGKFLIRTNPDTHSRAAIAAAKMGMSLNKYVEKAIEDENQYVLAI